jgi:hypothetical protein
LESDKDGEPPQHSGAVIASVIRDTFGFVFRGLDSYWRWARTVKTWPDRAIAYSPLLLVLYAAVSFSGLVKA